MIPEQENNIFHSYFISFPTARETTCMARSRHHVLLFPTGGRGEVWVGVGRGRVSLLKNLVGVCNIHTKIGYFPHTFSDLLKH